MGDNGAVRVFDRLLVRGVRSHIPDGAAVIALERGKSDALGVIQKMTAVLTDESLLVATSVRVKTILTIVPRADIRSVEVLEPHFAVISYDDYARAIKRVIKLDLRRSGDRSDLIGQLTA
jgi:hypothetical protein